MQLNASSYVSAYLRRLSFLETFPPVKRIRWFNLLLLVNTSALAGYGLLFVRRDWRTISFSALYYIFSMLGITAGYHRLWSHRSYNASPVLQYILILAGVSAVQGSCFWWARRHRSHHRHTDTDLDPYNAKRGLLWTHIGWMVIQSDLPSGSVDVSDLRNDRLIQWQHRWYFPLMVFFGYILPTIIPGLLWGDWKGGFYLAGTVRLTIAHHVSQQQPSVFWTIYFDILNQLGVQSTFSINSIAHWLGSTTYDDKLSPRDHLISAILTMGEGYHNFHHQFPMDYRNAFLWYQYDPTKWFIATCYFLGLASHLRVFPSNEVKKGALTMRLKELKIVQDSLVWPLSSKDLPVVDWETFQEDSKSRTVILVSGFIHDVSAFVDQHPGGNILLLRNSGKDMTASFFGGVYTHSNAAHNLLAMMRVGVLEGGTETLVGHVAPGQKLYISKRGSI